MEKPSTQKTGYILSICLNPVIQKTIVLPHLWENEVNRSKEYYLDASGKGLNISRILIQSGKPVVHLTHAGGRFKALFLEKCKKNNVNVHFIDSGSEIRCCYTLLNKKKHTTTEIVEEAFPVRSNTEERIYKEFLKLLPDSSVVIISGTKAAGYSDHIYPQMVKEAMSAHKFTILDLKNHDLENSLIYGPDIIKPNYSEFIGTFYKDIVSKESNSGDAFLEIVKNKMQTIYQEFGARTILTRGRFSTVYFNGDKTILLPPPECRNPTNTTGCGDAFTAGLVAGYLNESDMEEAILMGHDYALKNCLSVRPGYIK